jgi:hypothetical protein
MTTTRRKRSTRHRIFQTIVSYPHCWVRAAETAVWNNAGASSTTTTKTENEKLSRHSAYVVVVANTPDIQQVDDYGSMCPTRRGNAISTTICPDGKCPVALVLLVRSTCSSCFAAAKVSTPMCWNAAKATDMSSIFVGAPSSCFVLITMGRFQCH